jgi:RimJ/RimL family protein N-acetyltransferase
MADNAASIRVLEKLGMRLERHDEADGKVWVQYVVSH